MNPLFAASLFDSPWIILVILIVGALSQWLMKRRQAHEADSRPDDDAPPPSQGKPQAGSPRELDLPEALRRLLGGEPPPRVPQPPPIPPVMREAQAAEGWAEEEQFPPEQRWMAEAEEPYEPAPPPVIQTDPTRPSRAAVSARLVQPAVQAASRSQPLTVLHTRPAPVAGILRARRSREATRAIALLRDPRTARQAFVASLVFGPPKAFES